MDLDGLRVFLSIVGIYIHLSHLRPLGIYSSWILFHRYYPNVPKLWKDKVSGLTLPISHPKLRIIQVLIGNDISNNSLDATRTYYN